MHLFTSCIVATLFLSQALICAAREAMCPTSVAFSNTTRITSADPVKKYNEISGLVMSPKIRGPSKEPVLYGINDGGGGNRLGVWDSGTGERLLSFRIPSNVISNIDWETMAIGSCGVTGESSTCIYIGDTGDNPARVASGRRSRRPASTSYRIVKIKEPNYKNYQDNHMISSWRFSVLPFNYLDSSSPTKFADCEAMFLDHTGWGGAKGDIYVVPKWGRLKSKENNRVFKIPASAWPRDLNGSVGPMYSPKTIGTYRDGNDGIMGKVITSADMTLDGTVIAIGTTESSFLFLRCPGQTVADALASDDTQPCHSWAHPSSGQVETFAWDPDGESAMQVPEGENRRIGLTRLTYDASKTSKTCGQQSVQGGQVDQGGQVQVKWVCRSVNDDETLPDQLCIDAASNHKELFEHD